MDPESVPPEHDADERDTNGDRDEASPFVQAVADSRAPQRVGCD